MKFVCSNNPVFRILELPPKLMADHGDVKGRPWLWCVLNRENDPGGCEKENNHDQKRNYCPRQFDLSAAVDLRRLAHRVGISRPKSVQSNREQSADNQKNPTRNCNNKDREIEYLVRGCGRRSERGRDTALCQQGRCPQEACGGATKANQTSTRRHLHPSNSLLHYTSRGIDQSAHRNRNAGLSRAGARPTT